jgi:hypothetical protein
MKKDALNLVVGVLVGVLFTNSVWLWFGLESIIDIIVAILFIVGILVYNKNN